MNCKASCTFTDFNLGHLICKTKKQAMFPSEVIKI